MLLIKMKFKSRTLTEREKLEFYGYDSFRSLLLKRRLVAAAESSSSAATSGRNYQERARQEYKTH